MEAASQTTTTSTHDIEDKVEPPKLVWWFAIIGGLSTLALQGLSTEFYTFWITNLHPLPGQSFMMWLLIACLPIHIYEAVYCYRLAHRIGHHRSALGWAAQTFVLGYPSTRLLNQRARQMSQTTQPATQPAQPSRIAS